MARDALAAYTLCVGLLVLKFFMTISVQAWVRMRTKRFQYPEDARAFRGELAPEEADSVVRAQRVLRNDGESQPFFLAVAGLYVVCGAWPSGAWFYFGTYALSRWVHTLCLLRPTQPLRNFAFGCGILCLFAMLIHVGVTLCFRAA
ncbi:MAG: MAPEG family protein [Polyangiaceae bacterium]|nr:MAPEG family protein [Myxococcales bacterium]MCB9584113.1 MAPEG family protein [Polyangiaceae bacterium]